MYVFIQILCGGTPKMLSYFPYVDTLIAVPAIVGILSSFYANGAFSAISRRRYIARYAHANLLLFDISKLVTRITVAFMETVLCW